MGVPATGRSHQRFPMSSSAVASPASKCTVCASCAALRNVWVWVSVTATSSSAAVSPLRVSVKMTLSTLAVNAARPAAMENGGGGAAATAAVSALVSGPSSLPASSVNAFTCTLIFLPTSVAATV